MHLTRSSEFFESFIDLSIEIAIHAVAVVPLDERAGTKVSAQWIEGRAKLGPYDLAPQAFCKRTSLRLVLEASISEPRDKYQ